MKLIRLSQFQKLAGLSDRALSWLLLENRITCQADPAEGLLVDIDSVETEDLLKAIRSRREQIIGTNERVLMERMSSIVSRHLENIVDRVIHVITCGK